MARIIKRENWRVEVYPQDHAYGIRIMDTEKEYKDVCEDIQREIKRHVDKISQVYVCSDTTAVCSYCGDRWETDENGLPLCCLAAQEEFEREQRARA